MRWAAIAAIALAAPALALAGPTGVHEAAKLPVFDAHIHYKEPAWEVLLLKHSDRFMVGTDTWVNSQWADYDRLIA